MGEATHAMTLRLEKSIWHQLRTEAFEAEKTISDVIREAVDEHLARVRTKGCDDCGRPHTRVTAQGFRFCDAHAGGVTR